MQNPHCLLGLVDKIKGLLEYSVIIGRPSLNNIAVFFNSVERGRGRGVKQSGRTFSKVNSYPWLQVVALAEAEAELLPRVRGDVRPGGGGGVPDRPQAGAGRQPSGLSVSPGAQGAHQGVQAH